MYAISRAVAHDDIRVADAVTEQLRALFASDVAVLWLWDEANARLFRFTTSAAREDRLPRTRVDAGQGLIGQAFVSGQPVVVEDYAAYPERLPDVLQSGLRSAMAVPLVLDGRAIGVFVLGYHRRHRFSPDEREDVLYFAEQLAPVAGAVQLRMQLRRQRAEAEALADLARQGVRERDLGKLLSLVAEHTAKLLQADYSVVVALDTDQRIAHRGSWGVRGKWILKRRYPRRGGTTQAALEAGKTLVLESYGAGPAEPSAGPHALEQARTVFVTPLPTREGLSGVLHAGWRQPLKPGPDDVRLLETMAAFGAGIIDNARVQHDAQQHAAWLRAVIEHLPSGVSVVDAKGNLALFNQAARTILGADGLPWMKEGISLADPDVQQLICGLGVDLRTSALAAAIAGRPSRYDEYRLQGADGRQVWLRGSVSPVYSGKGEFVGTVSVFDDVTEAKQAAAARQRETERRLTLAAITEALSDASRDVRRMLDITTRELAAALDATCVIRLLVDDRLLRVIHSSVGEHDAAVRRALRRLSADPEVPKNHPRHWPVIRGGRPRRWFDPTGFDLRRESPPSVRAAYKDIPTYAIMIVPLQAHKSVGTIGLYRHRLAQEFTQEDEDFVGDVAARAGLVLENARLFEQLAASRARLAELSQRLVRLQERERRTIALELHDEVGQGLTAARLLLEAARRLPARLRDERLEEACRTLDEAVAQVRSLSLDLRPPMLERFGLAPALEALCDRFGSRTGIDVYFNTERLTTRAAPEVEIAAYRIVQEALTNVARHAAVDRVEVELWSGKARLWLRVADQGAGFDPARLAAEASTGLTGVQERAELLGGKLAIDSAPGAGTRLQAWFPLSSARTARRHTAAARR
jgi:PAS domain S-box-containing protein